MSEIANARTQKSQKSYHIEYLGETPVSKDCSSVVVPWVIEELRLNRGKSEEVGVCSFNSGIDYISVAKKDGRDVLKYSHNDVVLSATSHNSLSFAIVVRRGKENLTVCHGFTATSADVTRAVIQSLKKRPSLSATPEPPRRYKTLLSSSPIPKSSSAQEGLDRTDLSTSDPRETSRLKGTMSPDCELTFLVWEKEFFVHYAGSLRVRSPNTGSLNLDKLLNRLKKLQMSRRAPNIEDGVEDCDSPSLHPIGTALHNGHRESGKEVNGKKENSLINLLDSSESLLEDGSDPKSEDKTETERPGHLTPAERDGPHVAHVNTVDVDALHEPRNGEVTGSTLQQGVTDAPVLHVENGTVDSTKSQEDRSELDHEGTASAKRSAYIHDNGIYYRTVRIVVDTRKVTLRKVHSDQVVLEKKMSAIACCAQGKTSLDHFCFVSKEPSSDGAGSFYSHIFRADSKEQSYEVLDAFRTSFLQALTKTNPGVLCPSCPLLQLYLLCKDLENQGLTTVQQQTKVQDALLSLSDADYGILMERYKKKNLGSEHKQLVELVALYRKHLEEQQTNHTHSSNDDESAFQGKKLLEKGKLKSVSRLERAKQTVTSSLESIRSKVQRRNSSKVTEGPTLERQSRLKSPEVRSPLVQGTQAPEQKKSDTGEERKRSASMPEDPACVVSKDSKLKKTRSLKEKRLPPLDIKSVGLPSNDKVEPIPCRSHTVSLSSAHSNLPSNGSFSEPSSPVMSTPPQLRHRRQLSLVSPTSAQRNQAGKKSETCSYIASLMEVTPTKQRSWRQAAFDSATPRVFPGSLDRKQSIQDLIAPELKGLQTIGLHDDPKTRAQKRWQFLLEQQIMLNRMNSLNQTLQEESQVAEEKRKKLSYYDPTIHVLESASRWDEIIQNDLFDKEDLKLSLFRGVPPHKRGQVWSFLRKNFTTQEQERTEGEEGADEVDYHGLKEGETEYHQAISMDLGRTFPMHPYFCESYKKGQEELYNVLRAYSVADEEVGYCQGMSYIAGIFLIHSQEEQEAFKLLHHYMYDYGFRDHYKKDMFLLKVRMYQLSCQIHEYLPKLHAHLETHAVSTYLIAAPWFLTMFSSQYPFAFVSRVMDFVMHEGLEAFFKVSLALLTLHEDALLQCNSMESLSEFTKTTMPDTSLDHLPYIMTYVMTSRPEFSLKLKGFETEYFVLHNLKQSDPEAQKPKSVEEELEQVKEQNSFLIDEVAECCGNIRKLNTQLRDMETRMTAMEAQLKEKEKESEGKNSVIDLLIKRVDELERKLTV